MEITSNILLSSCICIYIYIYFGVCYYDRNTPDGPLFQTRLDYQWNQVPVGFPFPACTCASSWRRIGFNFRGKNIKPPWKLVQSCKSYNRIQSVEEVDRNTIMVPVPFTWLRPNKGCYRKVIFKRIPCCFWVNSLMILPCVLQLSLTLPFWVKS